jgi:hypothetical protein
MWSGATVAIVGGGPSLDPHDITVAHRNGARVIGVNDAYRFGVGIDLLFWGDFDWYFGTEKHQGHREGVLKWPGIRVTTAHQCAEEPAVHYLIANHSPGLHPPPYLKWYRNSGFSAVALAVLLGAKRIVLLGFDGKRVHGAHNWHVDNVRDVSVDVYQAHQQVAHQLVADVKAWPGAGDVQIWNATPNSAYTAFPITTASQEFPS